VQRLETDRLIQLLELGAKVSKVLEWKDRLLVLPGGRGGHRRTGRTTAAKSASGEGDI
jgi:hypothetical protein